MSPDALKSRVFACLCFDLASIKSLASLVGGLGENLAPNATIRGRSSFFPRPSPCVLKRHCAGQLIVVGARSSALPFNTLRS